MSGWVNFIQFLYFKKSTYPIFPKLIEGYV